MATNKDGKKVYNNVFTVDLDYDGCYMDWGLMSKGTPEMDIIDKNKKVKKIMKGIRWQPEPERGVCGRLYISEGAYCYWYMLLEYINNAYNVKEMSLEGVDMRVIYYEVGIEDQTFEEYCQMISRYKEWGRKKKEEVDRNMKWLYERAKL